MKPAWLTRKKWRVIGLPDGTKVRVKKGKGRLFVRPDGTIVRIKRGGYHPQKRTIHERNIGGGIKRIKHL
jgi:hypothetical protein